MCGGGGFIGQVANKIEGVGQAIGVLPKAQDYAALAPAASPAAPVAAAPVAATPAPETAATNQALADTQAAQSANAKLAARNTRRSASLLATGAGSSGMIQSGGGKSRLGA